MLTKFEIPIKRDGQPDEVLEVDPNDLNGNEDAIIEILTQEQSASDVFLQFAVNYTKKMY